MSAYIKRLQYDIGQLVVAIAYLKYKLTQTTDSKEKEELNTKITKYMGYLEEHKAELDKFLKNPATSERQRKFMCAELSRKQTGKRTITDMNKKQLRDFCHKNNFIHKKEFKEKNLIKIKHELNEEPQYKTYSVWRAAVKKLYPSAIFEGDKDIAQAFTKPRRLGGKGIGEWDGITGVIYYHMLLKKNPIKNESWFIGVTKAGGYSIFTAFEIPTREKYPKLYTAIGPFDSKNKAYLYVKELIGNG